MSANTGPDSGPIPWATIEAAPVAERRRLDRSASPRNANLWLGLRCVWELYDGHVNDNHVLQGRLGGSRSWPRWIGLTARCAGGSVPTGCTRRTTRARPRRRAGWPSWRRSNASSTRMERCRRPSGLGGPPMLARPTSCLLYTSDAADDLLCVDL